MAVPPDDRLRTGGGLDFLSAREGGPASEGALERTLRGRVLSGYRVGPVIGSGGMGCVLQGTRAEGDFDRVAAIKVVAVTHDGSELARRFRAEVKILASLNHPSIAQLYDAGETDEGWPYIVMEYVDGCPIDEYCSRHELGMEARVRLLRDVTEAVRFAHSRLVVHRDLKPSNALVGTDGKPKLLDFGIAKVLEDGAEGLTRPGAMTPRYASPEQLLGQPVAIASDIYQLGLLMSEVLGGCLPTAGKTLTEAIRRSAEGRLVTLPPQARAALPEELVLIIEQCLRTDPADRYRDASALRDDLAAFLTGYPVSAAGQRPAYRARKFLTRNWVGVLSATLTALALLTATVLTSLQSLEAQRQRNIAVQQQQRVQASNEFYSLLLEEMGNGAFTSVDLLDRGRALLEAQFGLNQPFVGSLLFDVSRRYANLGEQDAQRALLAEAEAIARRHGDRDLLAAVLCSTARSNQMGDPGLAAGQLEEGLRVYEGLTAPALETSMVCLRAQSNAAVRAGDFSAALAPLQVAQQIIDRQPAPGSRLRGLLLHDIAFAHFYDSRPDQAVAYLDEALSLLESTGRGGTLFHQQLQANRAVTLGVMDRTREALHAFATLTERMRASGFKGRGAAMQLAQHGDLLISVERVDEAAAIYAEGLDVAQAAGHSRVTAAFHVGLARVHLARAEFGPAAERLLEAERYVHGGEPRPLAYTIRTLRARLHRERGEPAVAADEISALLTEMGYPDNRGGTWLTAALAEGAAVYLHLGDYERALTLSEGLVERLEASRPAGSEGGVELGRALLTRGRVRLEAGDAAGAATDLESALPKLVDALGEAHTTVEEARKLLSQALESPAQGAA